MYGNSFLYHDGKVSICANSNKPTCTNSRMKGLLTACRKCHFIYMPLLSHIRLIWGVYLCGSRSVGLVRYLPHADRGEQTVTFCQHSTLPYPPVGTHTPDLFTNHCPPPLTGRWYRACTNEPFLFAHRQPAGRLVAPPGGWSGFNHVVASSCSVHACIYLLTFCSCLGIFFPSPGFCSSLGHPYTVYMVTAYI